MDSNEEILVDADNAKIVYAIPAKPRPAAPWWQENFGGWVIIGLCWLGLILIWME